jgi:hypothetical protein
MLIWRGRARRVLPAVLLLTLHPHELKQQPMQLQRPNLFSGRD